MVKHFPPNFLEMILTENKKVPILHANDKKKKGEKFRGFNAKKNKKDL